MTYPGKLIHLKLEFSCLRAMLVAPSFLSTACRTVQSGGLCLGARSRSISWTSLIIVQDSVTLSSPNRPLGLLKLAILIFTDKAAF